MLTSDARSKSPILRICGALLFAVAPISVIAKHKPPSENVFPTPIPNGTLWRIERPDVSAIRKEYPQIQFRPSDIVTITGGGCVQTGGSGLTWKRYIDPSGSNSDRLYHGRIWIPGATDGLVRISSLVGGSSLQGIPLVVQNFPPHVSTAFTTLWLAYEDDKYRDNGYYKHDNGTDNQCSIETTPTDNNVPKIRAEDVWPAEDASNNGNAWLEIRIVHSSDATVSPVASDPKAPLDLWWEKIDDNFLPFNPDWWIHKKSNGFILPNSNSNNSNQACDQFREGPKDKPLFSKDIKCTTWDPDVDEANALSLFCHFDRLFSNSVHGHVNWGAVTYRGKIYFDRSNNFHPEDPKLDPPGDGDYDWLLAPQDENGNPIDNGVAEGNDRDSKRALNEDNMLPNARAIALEFSSRETIDHFNGSKWWDEFHDKVDHNPGLAQQMVKGKEAIVIGLIGFDNEHGELCEGARVELHPVWAIAIHDPDFHSEDVWAIFARNWGNEGSCSNGWDITHSKWQHNLALRENKLKFFIPIHRLENINVSPFFCSNYGDKCKTTSFEIDKTSFPDGILLTIQLPEPEERKLFWGEIHLKKS